MTSINSGRQNNHHRIAGILLRGAAAAVLTVFTLAAPAFAQSTDTQTKQVSVGDLNLASPAGRAELTHRLAQASRQVCDRGESRALDDVADELACRKTAFDQAMRAAAPMIAAASSQAVTKLASERPF